jgi:hypothetical protein
MKAVDRILGKPVKSKRIPPPTKRELADPEYVFFYARDEVRGRWPKGEATILQDPYWSYRYARDVIKGPWPEAEAIIAEEPCWARDYAKLVINRRFFQAEYGIAHSIFKDEYLEAFPDAKDDWVMNGWLDWLDT